MDLTVEYVKQMPHGQEKYPSVSVSNNTRHNHALTYVSLYTGSVAAVESTSYTVNKNAGSVGIGVRLDWANCETVNFILTPQVQSPVDASSKQ